MSLRGQKVQKPKSELSRWITKYRLHLAILIIAVGVIATVAWVIQTEPFSPFSISPVSETVILSNGNNSVPFTIYSPTDQHGLFTGIVQPSNVSLEVRYVIVTVNITVIPATLDLHPGSNSVNMMVQVSPFKYFGSGTFTITPSWSST